MHRGATWQLNRQRLHTVVRQYRRVVVLPAADLKPIDFVIIDHIRELQRMDVIVRGHKLPVAASAPYIYQRLNVLKARGIVVHTSKTGYRLRDSRNLYTAA